MTIGLSAEARLWLNLIGSTCSYLAATYIVATSESRSVRLSTLPTAVFAAIYAAVFAVRLFVPKLVASPDSFWSLIGTDLAIFVWPLVWMLPVVSRERQVRREIAHRRRHGKEPDA